MKKIFLIGCVSFSSMMHAQNLIGSSGNVGIGTTTPGTTLQVNGHTSLGDAYDGSLYGLLQLVRPASPGDNKFHLSMIRNGMSVAGMGYAPGTNTIGIWRSNTTAGVPAIAVTSDSKIGLGLVNPVENLTIAGGNGNIHIGNTNYNGYNGISLNGSNNLFDYNLVSSQVDYNLYINRPGAGNMFFRMGNNTQMLLGSNGNLGVGGWSVLPSYRLDVKTDAATDGINLQYNTTGFLRLYPNSLGDGWLNPITKSGDAGMIFGKGTNPGEVDFGLTIAPWNSTAGGLRVNHEGRVSIGTSKTSSGYKLFVEEGIRTRKVKVDQVTWADFVFDQDYPLLPITEVEKFIHTHKHLPGVPSAKEIEEQGLDLGNGQAVLLKKIEELTLYLIQLQKENNQMKEDILRLQQSKK